MHLTGYNMGMARLRVRFLGMSRGRPGQKRDDSEPCSR